MNNECLDGRTVGFVGLGHMGGPMAHRLIDTGFQVLVSDPRAEAVAAAMTRGAAGAVEVGAMTGRCQVVLVCVNNDAQVRDVVEDLLRQHNAWDPLRAIVVHSTVSPELILELDASGDDAGVAVIDAPVSGNLEARADGTLAMMVGASADDLGENLQVLRACSADLVLTGRRGSGSVLKLINNVMALIQVISMAEALALGEKFGIDSDTLKAGLSGASGDCYALQNLDYYRDFPDAHPLGGQEAFYEFMCKDLWLAVDAGAAAGARLPFVSAAAAIAPEVYRRFWPLDTTGTHS